MSNTIIMYENGKAVGGEGHPTNADEITFDNTGTDLVSEEVESAIKEVNAKFDKGSVSVTANGVKTFSALLAELFALVDVDKINKNSVLIDGLNMHHAETINRTANEYYFTRCTLTSTTMYIVRIGIGTNAFYGTSATTYSTNATAYTNQLSAVPANGYTIMLEY